MFSFKSIVLIAAAFAVGAECSGVAVAAPLVAPAHVGYAQAIPQNIPPYASQVSVVNRALSPLVASPFAAPYVAGPAPYVAGPSPYVNGPAPYVAGPAPYAAYASASAYAPAAYAAAPFAAPFAAPAAFPAPAAYAAAPAAYAAAPFPYAPAAPIVRAPFGVAPAFVR